MTLLSGCRLLLEDFLAEEGISKETNRVATRRRQRLRFVFGMIGRCENGRWWMVCLAGGT